MKVEEITDAKVAIKFILEAVKLIGALPLMKGLVITTTLHDAAIMLHEEVLARCPQPVIAKERLHVRRPRTGGVGKGGIR